MSSHVTSRQPFAALDGSRLQSLKSLHNRQKTLPSLACHPVKQSMDVSKKRRFSTTAVREMDAENIDPSILNSPKRHKNFDGSSKVTHTLSVSNPTESAINCTRTSAPVPSATQRLLQPISTKIMSIKNSRGSPKHKRVSLLKPRATAPSYARVDPPLSQSGRQRSTLPFSLDAALSGTISSYSLKDQSVAAASIIHTTHLASQKSMPKSWFFDIHEDSPDDEAANLMQHSTYVLDISSDDDKDTKLRSKDSELGKENIPPPNHLTNVTTSRMTSLTSEAPVLPGGLMKAGSTHQRAKFSSDVMVKDRIPLSSISVKECYPDVHEEELENMIIENEDRKEIRQPEMAEGPIHSQQKEAVEDLGICQV